MKKLWSYASFLAVVNMLAMIMFIGWLWKSDRLSRDRLRDARALFSTTIADAEAAAAEADAAMQLEQDEAADRALRKSPPLPSSAMVAHRTLVDDQTDHAMRRLDDETAKHLEELAFRVQQLDRREAELLEQREAWEQSIATESDRRKDAQFAKAVRTLESLAGKQAKAMLLEMVGLGKIDQAVTYLDAMNSRAATKTLRELKTGDENKLATELLERLRIHGLDAANPENASDDPARQPTPGPSAAALADPS